MFLTPLNYSFPMQLVPVYEWESVANPSDGTSSPAPPPPSCDGSDSSTAAADPAAPSSELRLVFKGYEWRLVAERNVYPREDWESIFRPEADAKDDERDPHRHDTTRRPTVPPPKPTHDISTNLHPTDPSPGKSDPSES